MKTKLDLVHFAHRGKDSFMEAVTARVGLYFKTNNISPYANSSMWVKTFLMLGLYITPYVFMMINSGSSSLWIFWIWWVVMGWGMVGIGTSVMHDANHGSYSPRKWVNKATGHVLEAIGGYSVNWKIQHNVLHHTYTNINGLDDDIGSFVFLRLSPSQKRYWFHRYQYLYAWFFYMMMTLFWMTAKDYLQAVRYKRHNLLHKYSVTLKQAIYRITFYKALYYGYILVLPILFSGVSWYFVLTGFVMMHAIAGLLLACIFQPSHVMEDSGFAVPVMVDGVRRMEDSWAIHEVTNTTNFAPRNVMLSWFIGGLNYQIEHHLFSGICHVHYKKIAPIVKSTTAAYGLPYNEQPTFFQALLAHAKMLKKLGKE